MILAVEDNDDIRILFGLILKSAGFDIASVGGGREALRWLEENPAPELIVLDVQMPDVDGWQTLSAIRARPATASVPVVMCTVKSRSIDQARGWELGCDAYLVKPFEIDSIVSTIKDVLKRSPDERARMRRAASQNLSESVQS